jgi:hypothetical protein
VFDPNIGRTHSGDLAEEQRLSEIAMVRRFATCDDQVDEIAANDAAAAGSSSSNQGPSLAVGLAEGGKGKAGKNGTKNGSTGKGKSKGNRRLFGAKARRHERRKKKSIIMY